MSYFFNGYNTNHIEGLFKNFSDSFTKNDPGVHMLVSDDSVFLIVLLYLDGNIVNEVSGFV